MSEYIGKTQNVRVRIKPNPLTPYLRSYVGQDCDAILYEQGVMPQINTEQLIPPLPKWQSAKAEDLEIIT